jgi:hypothetical protein
MAQLSSQAIAPSRVQWTSIFGTTGEDRPSCIREARGGGYMLAVKYWPDVGAGYGGRDGWLARLDAKGQQLWQKNFGGSSNEWFATVLETSDGGWIAGGQTFSGPSGNKESLAYGQGDYWVVRVTPDGEKVWEKTFGGISDDEVRGIAETADGGFIIAGKSASNVTGNKTVPWIGYPFVSRDIWVIRTDASGDVLWQRSYGGGFYDQPYAIECTASGGFVIAAGSESSPGGTKQSPNYGMSDAWILCLDPNGQILWERAFGGSSGDWAVSVHQTTDAGFVVGAITASGISGNKTTPHFGSPNYWIIRLDASGNKLWEQTFGANNSDWLSAVFQTLDGNFIVGGFSDLGTGGNKIAPNREGLDGWFLRLNSEGDRIWEETYGATISNTVYPLDVSAMALTQDGGIVFAGEAYRGGDPSGADIIVVKLAPDALTAPALRILRSSAAASDTRLELSGIPGRSYIMESSSDFISWTPFATNVFATNALDFPDPLPDPAKRIYRARLMP